MHFIGFDIFSCTSGVQLLLLVILPSYSANSELFIDCFQIAGDHREFAVIFHSLPKKKSVELSV